MKTIWIWLLVIAMSIGCLAGCSTMNTPPVTPPATTAQETQTQPTLTPDETDPTETQPPETTLPETQPPETQPKETQSQEEAIGHEDTYWIATEWYGSDLEGAESLPTEFWNLDLIVRPNGTARFRDVHEGIYLSDDSYLNLSWERTPEGEFLFFSPLYPQPVLRGFCNNGVLSVQYWGTDMTMVQAPMPQTVGQLHIPAELPGTWLLVSGETEGYQWDAMPNELTSIVLRVTSVSGPLVLVADIEQRDPSGSMVDSSYAQSVEILSEPLYEGCENEVWSIRIGDRSDVDANGYPVNEELYATLLSDNKLLLQRRYTLDGSPAVSYQTYLRLTDLVSWMRPESMELELSNWVCTGYQDAEGNALPLPAELEGFSMVLWSDQVCQVDFGDGNVREGTWMLDNGGVLLLRSNEAEAEPFWFGGVISGYMVETTDALTKTYQMALYYNGGILELETNGYG